MVARAVRCADEANIFNEIAVSTDSDAIRIACGAFTIMRPDHLCTDDANVEDAIRHVLDYVGSGFDMLALLQPTSPTRTPEIVRECVEEIGVHTGVDAAFTVSEVPVKYHARMQLEANVYWSPQQAHPQGKTVTNRQELSQTFIRNGLCYAVEVAAFHKHGLFGSRCRIIPSVGRHVNIDTPEDLEEARRVLA